MNNPSNKRRTARRGVAMLVALIFLAIFASLAVAIASMADTNTVVSRNRINADQAQAIAETGIQMIQHSVGGIGVPSSHLAYDIHQAIGTQLQNVWHNSTMVNATDITYDFWGVNIPTITRQPGRRQDRHH